MATVVFSNLQVCPGGCHVSIDTQLDGGPVVRRNFLSDEIRADLGDLTDEQRDELALNLLKLKCRGMTRVQARNALLPGLTVTL